MRKNLEQSEKSKSGNNFNEHVAEKFKQIDNSSTNKTIIFTGKEPTFYQTIKHKLWVNYKRELKMDNGLLIINHLKKEVLYILSDGTTIYRKDRARGKAAEGAFQQRMKDVIEKHLFQRYPELRGYTVTHITILLFPSELNKNLKNLKAEYQAIRNVCIEINYGLSEMRSDDNVFMLAAAMTLSELEAVIFEIVENPTIYSFTKDTLANVWQQMFQSWEYMPCVQLT